MKVRKNLILFLIFIIPLIILILTDYSSEFSLTASLVNNLDSLFIKVNKKISLGQYIPPDLVELSELGAKNKYIRKVVYEDLKRMIFDAKEKRVSLKILSAYRSYNYQKILFSYYYRLFGKTALKFSAEAGHSEHQLGTTIDFGIGDRKIDLTRSFATTLEGRWLENNARNYGFVMSYPEGGEEVTGYIYEPWHYRYIGVKAASKFYNSGLSLEEFLFNFPGIILEED